jgi:hypothetical protein
MDPAFAGSTQEMMSSRSQSNILLGVVLFCLVGVPLLLCLFVAGIYSGHSQAALRFLGGFYFFLRENLPRISTNAATWVPGVIAFFLGVAAMHLFFRSWAERKGRLWQLGTSFALASIIPIFFVIAFLVPGVLLQVRVLSSDPEWFHREVSTSDSMVRHDMQLIATRLYDYAAENDGQFPDALEDALSDDDKDSFSADWSPLRPSEPFIYLGGGLSDTSDPGLPLLISRQLVGRSGGLERKMLTIGNEMRVIPAEAAEEWITRSLKARREPVSPPK